MMIRLSLLLVEWDPLHVAGDLGSLIGLAISLVVLAVAKKARDAALEAAHEAKRTLTRKFLASDLRSCSDDLDLLSSLWDGNWPQKPARLLSHRLAHRLLGRLTQLSTHPWKPHFDSETLPALQTIVQECGKLVIELRKTLYATPIENKAPTVPDAISDLSGLLATEIGRYQFD